MSKAAKAAEPAARIVGKKQLCAALGWSRMKLDRRLEEDAAFPVKARGGQGKPWEFDLDEVEAYLEPEAPDAADDAASGQPVRPGDPIELTARQRRDLASAMQIEDKLRKSRDELVEAGPLKMALSDTVTRVSTGLNSMADVLVRRLNLPETALPVIRQEIDQLRRTMVIGLREVLTDE